MPLVRNALAVSVLPILTAAATAAEPLDCTCQHVVTCGAAACGPAGIEICPSTDIRLLLGESPGIQLCVFTDCLQGPARQTTIPDAAIVLDGAYRPTHNPEADPTAVVATIDQRTGIGTIQSGGEEGITQFSVICRPAGP